MIKLSDIIHQIKKEQKTIIKKTIRETRSMSIKLFVIEDVLNSGALSIQEVQALREFFKFRKSVPLLNENTIRSINKEMIREGFFDWIKNKANSFKDALSAGWDKLKSAWANFKEFVSKLIEQIKSGLKNFLNSVINQVSEALAFGSKIAAKIQEGISKKGDFLVNVLAKVSEKTKIEGNKIHSSLKEDIETIASASSHIINTVQEKFVNASDFVNNAINGNLQGDMNIEERFLNDKKLVEVLIVINEEGIEHPEGLLKKYPALQKVVKVVLNIFKWTFGIFSTLIKKFFEALSSAIFSGIDYVSKALGGPTSSSKPSYAALAALVGELAEIVGHNVHAVHDVISSLITIGKTALIAMCPAIAPAVEIIATTIEIVGTFFVYYAMATVILNTIVPAVKKLVEYINTDKEFASKLASMLAGSPAAR